MAYGKPSDPDAPHRVVVKRLLGSLDFRTEDATERQDYNSEADIWVVGTDGVRWPVGLKWRGKNSGLEFNITAWSEKLGRLPEFSTLGGKVYMYRMLNEHVLVRFKSQDFLEQYWPAQGFSRIENGDNWKWIEIGRSGVRRRSRCSNVQQGVIFHPSEAVEIIMRWNLNENMILA